MASLGNCIRILRQARGLTSARLAEKAGMSAAYLSLIEAGERVPPSETISRLAAALNVDVALLEILLSDAPPPPRSRRIHELATVLRQMFEAEAELKRKLA